MEQPTATSTESGMRRRAKEFAVELLIIHGYRGFSFGMLAERLGTTRANLHYHFGGKMRMAEEIIDEYAAETAARFRAIWIAEDLGFSEKVMATFGFNRDRYHQFNDSDGPGRPWSLIARMRNDFDVLSPDAVERLRAFTRETAADVAHGIRMSIDREELIPETPIDDVALQMTSIINSAAPIIYDSGSILRLERLYRAFLETVTRAYGAR